MLREITSATPWRAFFIFAALTLRLCAAPVAGAPPELVQTGKPDAAEAAAILEQFRHAGIPGGYYLEFELRTRPRRGEEKVFGGRLWGGRNDQGAVNRIELTDAAGRPHRLLVQNGERGKVWRVETGKAVPVEAAALLAPVIPGVEISAFDLQMPYLYWPGGVLHGIKRVLGRPAYVFAFPAPADFSAGPHEIAATQAYLDTQFNVLLKTELLDREGRVLKTFAIVSLKTLDRQPLPKAIDFLNGISRDKTRLQITSAALNLDLAPALFDPATLPDDVRPPAAEQRLRMDP